MASSTTASSTTLSVVSSTLRQLKGATSSQCVPLPPLLIPISSRLWNSSSTTTRSRDVVAMATTGEATTAEIVAPPTTETEKSETELPDFVKTLQETWDKVEDKYAVTSLAAAGAIGLWASAGMISAIDRLPLVPGVLELVGIGYTGWFAYKNFISTSEREALIQKIKDTYKDIIGSS